MNKMEESVSASCVLITRWKWGCGHVCPLQSFHGLTDVPPLSALLTCSTRSAPLLHPLWRIPLTVTTLCFPDIQGAHTVKGVESNSSHGEANRGCERKHQRAPETRPRPRSQSFWKILTKHLMRSEKKENCSTFGAHLWLCSIFKYAKCCAYSMAFNAGARVRFLWFSRWNVTQLWRSCVTFHISTFHPYCFVGTQGSSWVLSKKQNRIRCVRQTVYEQNKCF